MGLSDCVSLIQRIWLDDLSKDQTEIVFLAALLRVCSSTLSHPCQGSPGAMEKSWTQYQESWILALNLPLKAVYIPQKSLGLFSHQWNWDTTNSASLMGGSGLIKEGAVICPGSPSGWGVSEPRATLRWGRLQGPPPPCGSSFLWSSGKKLVLLAK